LSHEHLHFPHFLLFGFFDVNFYDLPEGIKVVVVFDPEGENSMEMQKNGWQAISDNFKKYVESH
jgi:hypothetical protein